MYDVFLTLSLDCRIVDWHPQDRTKFTDLKKVQIMWYSLVTCPIWFSEGTYFWKNTQTALESLKIDIFQSPSVQKVFKMASPTSSVWNIGASLCQRGFLGTRPWFRWLCFAFAWYFWFFFVIFFWFRRFTRGFCISKSVPTLNNRNVNLHNLI